MPSHQGADSRKAQNQVWLGKYAAQLDAVTAATTEGVLHPPISMDLDFEMPNYD